jgi:hypothetical protein
MSGIQPTKQTAFRETYFHLSLQEIHITISR